ncbi:GntR family transcriptional regulator [Bradyrhizobium sp. NP1]|uniref:GntR family transcriptional regulator n=1 Tax=Bradyrhizobium sp. NP1 TaxID=3049772 RepID=UPI0025A50169|nr:GntR family transcriptional regulator [Bradyrhizobium sp. NP1]WJR77902.1 GntR family transcriptional regulator [Bradyrhizobium sp. NP1]
MARLTIPPVVKMPVEAQATDTLRDSIVNGTIPAGARITEIQLSQQLNLSRATIRTALHQLAKEGLLNLVPYTGWTVLSLSARDVWELYTLRSAVERLAAQLVATSINSAKSSRLNWAFEGLVKECKRGIPARVAEADFALHKTIIQMADHTRLASQYALIEQQIRMYIRSSDALITEISAIIDQHRPIVDSILSGDVEASGHLSEQHNLTEGRKLSEHIERLEARAEAAKAPAAPAKKTATAKKDKNARRPK